MDDIRAAFDQFCREHGIEATERDYVMFVAGIHSTLNQVPVAYAHLDAAGVPLEVVDSITPGVLPSPLYARPIANVKTPPPSKTVIDYAWRNYGEPYGFANWLHWWFSK